MTTGKPIKALFANEGYLVHFEFESYIEQYIEDSEIFYNCFNRFIVNTFPDDFDFFIDLYIIK